MDPRLGFADIAVTLDIRVNPILIEPRDPCIEGRMGTHSLVEIGDKDELQAGAIEVALLRPQLVLEDKEFGLKQWLLGNLRCRYPDEEVDLADQACPLPRQYPVEHYLTGRVGNRSRV